MSFINLKLIQGGSIEVNVNQAPVIRVAELEDKTFAIIMTILPGKDIMIDRGPKTFATRAEAEAAAEILVTEINAAMNTGGGTGSDYDDSKITDYVYTSSGALADGLNPLNNVDLENVRDMFHPEDIITVSNIKIGHTMRLRINRKSGGYTEYGVATIIGYNNEDETEIQTIVKKFSGSILNSESQFLALGTIIKHPDYPKNIYVNTTAGNFSLSNFDSALAVNVVRPLQDKLVAGDNITIDPDTNEISASGGGSQDLSEYVKKDNQKLQAIELEGDGTKYLSNDGTYKPISGGSGGDSPIQVHYLDELSNSGILDLQLLDPSRAYFSVGGADLTIISDEIGNEYTISTTLTGGGFIFKWHYQWNVYSPHLSDLTSGEAVLDGVHSIEMNEIVQIDVKEMSANYTPVLFSYQEKQSDY